MEIDKKKQGKKNRAAGLRFELRVRNDLESVGWIVSKWVNNVELHEYDVIGSKDKFDGSFLVPAKHKFRGPGIPMAMGTGFPDFIAFRPRLDHFASYCSVIPEVEIGRENLINDMENEVRELYEIVGVESKMNGYLDKKEKEKCKWLLENNIFSKILIAHKGKKRGEILYKEFK